MEWKAQLCELKYNHCERRAIDKAVRNDEWLTMGYEICRSELTLPLHPRLKIEGEVVIRKAFSVAL